MPEALCGVAYSHTRELHISWQHIGIATDIDVILAYSHGPGRFYLK